MRAGRPLTRTFMASREGWSHVVGSKGAEQSGGDKRGNFRLNPAIVVTHVNWEALARHPDPWVQPVAAERRKRLHGA